MTWQEGSGRDRSGRAGDRGAFWFHTPKMAVAAARPGLAMPVHILAGNRARTVGVRLVAIASLAIDALGREVLVGFVDEPCLAGPVVASISIAVGAAAIRRIAGADTAGGSLVITEGPDRSGESKTQNTAGHGLHSALEG